MVPVLTLVSGGWRSVDTEPVDERPVWIRLKAPLKGEMLAVWKPKGKAFTGVWPASTGLWIPVGCEDAFWHPYDVTHWKPCTNSELYG